MFSNYLKGSAKKKNLFNSNASLHLLFVLIHLMPLCILSFDCYCFRMGGVNRLLRKKIQVGLEVTMHSCTSLSGCAMCVSQSVHVCVCLCVYISLYLYMYLSACFSIYLSVCLSLSPSLYPDIFLFVYPPVNLIYLYICTYLSVCLSVYLLIYLSLSVCGQVCVCVCDKKS